MIPALPMLLDRRYRLQRVLSAGEDESRYLGRHIGLDLAVRVTVLHPRQPGTCPTPGDGSRFCALAQQAASLRHPALPRVRDCFRSGSAYVLVEDAILGEALADRLSREGRLSLRATLALGLRLCDALARAAKGSADLVPFTTVDPRAITYLPSGHVVLTDLGARHWLRLPLRPVDAGMAAFRAPELGDAASADARVDVYSIAAVIYFALTGHQPAPWFPDARPLDTLEPDIPAALSQVLHHALAADPDLRYGGAEHLGRALAMAARIALPEVAALTVPATRRRKRAKPAIPPVAQAEEAPRTPDAVAAPVQADRTPLQARLASDLLRLSIAGRLRRVVGRIGAVAGSPAHFGA